jgi:serine/threonine-protein kinase
MAVNLADLVAAIHRLRLLAPAQLDELTQSLQGQHDDARSLAIELVKRQWLTSYQLNRLLNDKGDELVMGQYIVLERLGGKRISQVYKARHQHMKRVVALHILRQNVLARPALVERFYAEIQAVSQLSHPNLVEAYDAGPIGRTHFFAGEYVAGLDMAALVKQLGRLPLELACNYVRQAALGLQHAHERGLRHHDLSPANLLVTRVASAAGDAGDAEDAVAIQPTPEFLASAVVKVRNLGLTLLHHATENSFTPVPDAQADEPGDPDAYTAPEELINPDKADIRADLYSLGCVFSHLLTGLEPTGSSSNRAPGSRARGVATLSAELFKADVPSNVVAVLRRLRAEQPEARYESPAELIGVLDRIIASFAAPAGPPSVTLTPPSAPPSTP